jgi:hypothetical protein
MLRGQPQVLLIIYVRDANVKVNTSALIFFIVAPCIMKNHGVLHTNESTNYNIIY